MASGSRYGTRSVTEERGSKTFQQFTVGNVPVCLAPTDSRRLFVLIYNNGQVPIYLGANNVTVAGPSIPIAAGGTFTDDISNDSWYAITAGVQCDIRVVIVLGVV